MICLNNRNYNFIVCLCDIFNPTVSDCQSYRTSYRPTRRILPAYEATSDYSGVRTHRTMCECRISGNDYRLTVTLSLNSNYSLSVNILEETFWL